MNLLSKAIDGRKKLIDKSVKTLTRKMKKHIKKEAVMGRLNSNLDITSAGIMGLSDDMDIEVYDKVCDILNSFYKGSVTVEVERHGYCNSHRRLKARINREQSRKRN